MECFLASDCSTSSITAFWMFILLFFFYSIKYETSQWLCSIAESSRAACQSIMWRQCSRAEPVCSTWDCIWVDWNAHGFTRGSGFSLQQAWQVCEMTALTVLIYGNTHLQSFTEWLNVGQNKWLVRQAPDIFVCVSMCALSGKFVWVATERIQSM